LEKPQYSEEKSRELLFRKRTYGVKKKGSERCQAERKELAQEKKRRLRPVVKRNARRKEKILSPLMIKGINA